MGLFEAQSIRIGETETDAISVSFLKDLFGDQIDGYIAPKMKSPFHFGRHVKASPSDVRLPSVAFLKESLTHDNEYNKQGGYNPAEIVLFNPKKNNKIELIEKLDNYTIENWIFQDYLLKVKISNFINFKPKITKKLQVDYRIVNKGLENSSLILIGGYINNSEISNKILDEGGENYNKIQKFVKKTIMKLFGDDYYINMNKKKYTSAQLQALNSTSTINYNETNRFMHPYNYTTSNINVSELWRLSH